MTAPVLQPLLQLQLQLQLLLQLLQLHLQLAAAAASPDRTAKLAVLGLVQQAACPPRLAVGRLAVAARPAAERPQTAGSTRMRSPTPSAPPSSRTASPLTRPAERPRTALRVRGRISALLNTVNNCQSIRISAMRVETTPSAMRGETMKQWPLHAGGGRSSSGASSASGWQRKPAHPAPRRRRKTKRRRSQAVCGTHGLRRAARLRGRRF